MVTYDPEAYWTERYEGRGIDYVARGGRRTSSLRQIEAITPYFDMLPTEGKVLDFGCGPYRFRNALRERGLEYEGVDLIPGFGTMDVDAIEPESFDCATAIFVLQHIVDPGAYRETIGTLYGALRDGGTLLVVDHVEGDDLDAHMMPRGPVDLWEQAPWSAMTLAGAWRNHWIGTFER